MSILFICTIGGRDIRLNGDIVVPARTKGEKILSNFDQVKAQLEFPMITLAMEYILRHSQMINRVVLVATDQPKNSTPKEFWMNDTLYFAQIIQKFLQEKYINKGKIKEISFFYIEQNPSLVDEMFDLFGRELKNNKIFKIKDLKDCYTLTTGGIPGANNALLFQAIQNYKAKCSSLYISEATGRVIPLNIGRQLLTKYRYDLVKTHLENWNYSAAASLLTEETLCHQITQYATHRLYFDFERALFWTEEAMKENPECRDFCESLREDLVILTQPREQGASKLSLDKRKALIRELYLNLEIKYKCKEYIDFLGRIFRFQEDVLRYIFEKETKHSTDLDEDTRIYLEFTKYIEENQKLRDFLNKQTYGGKPLEYSRPNMPTLMAILNFYILGRRSKNYPRIYEIFQKVNKLSSLRNKTAIAHGYESVSREKIREIYGGEILKDLEEVTMLIGLNVSENPYQGINRFIKEKLKIT